MNPMALQDTTGASEEGLLWITGIGKASIILMAAFLLLLMYRDRTRDKRSKQ
jgi:hypothetical protein